jgi:hypothetical protein
MSASVRPPPVIPDHEVLRKIGGGAYGEVWLARAVTGALRAVKVLRRGNFEDDRGFEREFEGIRKFEPVSRDHPGLVHILHVGRGMADEPFYYYLMELGDDVSAGRMIHPADYQPRTLRGDQPGAPLVRYDTGECIEVGLRLAGALQHLHESGLAHRDVKPSNIIFVNGKAKLADIGLVAARGQRTFVGTEGFVPPEGPGSAQADIYSLGKVLYEMATGRDRMDFPELPDELPGGRDRKRWLELNRVICDVCEPRVSRRRITTAAQLAEALGRISRGGSGLRPVQGVWLATCLLTLFSGWALWHAAKTRAWFDDAAAAGSPQVPAEGLLRVFSTPEGADVIDSRGVVIGTTPTSTLNARVGEEVSFTLRKDGYRPQTVSGMVEADSAIEPMVLSVRLGVFAPPQSGEIWTDHLGNRYLPVEGRHVRSGYVTRGEWEKFVAETGTGHDAAVFHHTTQDGLPVEVVLATPAATQAFCGWLREGAIKEGHLTWNDEIRARRDGNFRTMESDSLSSGRNLLPFHLVARRIRSGRLLVTSDPAGADVYLDGRMAGKTDQPLDIPGVRPGKARLMLVMEGYKPERRMVVIPEGALVEQSIVLERNEGVVFGHPWENGISMRFVPVGPDLMASVWETRVCDYALFVTETGTPYPPAPPFTQEPDHPVINVTLEDARAFCQWLTRRERRDGRITLSHEYRLPTDTEWSLMAGLSGEDGGSPGARDARKQPVFPWGPDWPDGRKVGNFADMAAAITPGMPADRTIAGYDDGFPHTAPVGSFDANSIGLHDISGNVQEWVDDAYSKHGGEVLGVLRGGGWNTHQLENLYTGSRNAVPAGYRDEFYGFRVVLAKSAPTPE